MHTRTYTNTHSDTNCDNTPTRAFAQLDAAARALRQQEAAVGDAGMGTLLADTMIVFPEVGGEGVRGEGEGVFHAARRTL